MLVYNHHLHTKIHYQPHLKITQLKLVNLGNKVKKHCRIIKNLSTYYLLDCTFI